MSTQADDLDLNGAVHEGADADLGDMRRTKRLVERAQVLAQHPTAALPEACGEGAMLKTASRFFANWTRHPATTGWGPLGHPAGQGLHVPRTLACTPERVPLGLWAQQVWARDPDDVGTRTRRTQLPMPQQASQQWRTSLEAARRARAACAHRRELKQRTHYNEDQHALPVQWCGASITIIDRRRAC